MNKLHQLFPFPEDGDLVEENPLVLCFAKEENIKTYTILVKDSEGNQIVKEETEKNYLILKDVLPEGEYSWNLLCDGKERGWWKFRISPDAVKFIRPTAGEVFDAVPDVRPRHLFFDKDIPLIKADKCRELETLQRNIELAKSRELPDPPLFHKREDVPDYREYFGAYRDYCDRDMVACALGYAILGDKEAGEKAKELFLTICDWNPLGPCSLIYPWNDEIGLSNARCLPSVYDLIYDLLTEQQRYLAEKTIEAYALQCEARIIRTDYTANPGNSHVGRIPAYMGEAAMVLKGSKYIDEKTLLRWMELALDIYGGIFPFFGSTDGGWAEGTFYSTSYTRWYLPFFMAVERFSGYRFLDRPFYQRLTQFFLHFAIQERENHPFGDGYWCDSDSEEWPGFFAQNPFRLYADRFGPKQARVLAKKYAAPEIFKLHLLDIFIPAGKGPENSLTGEQKGLAVFPKSGFVSCQTNLESQDNNIALVIRASRFGNISHQHADQGNFALYANNIALISPSGYYGRKFGSNHHAMWTRTSKAHNCILVDGVGQQVRSREAVGKIIECRHKGEGTENQTFWIDTDLSKAYPMLTDYHRYYTLVDSVAEGKKLIIEDVICAENPCEITWCLHALSMPVIEGMNGLLIEHRGQSASVIPDESFGMPVISDKFDVDINDGYEPDKHVSRPTQYHAYYKTQKAQKHNLKVVIEIGV